MGSDTAATLIIGGLGLVVSMLGGVLALTARGSARWGRLLATVEAIQRDAATYAAAHEKVHAEMTGALRADREATGRRLADVERAVWALSPPARAVPGGG